MNTSAPAKREEGQEGENQEAGDPILAEERRLRRHLVFDGLGESDLLICGKIVEELKKILRSLSIDFER
jgi:hypothetical protein